MILRDALLNALATIAGTRDFHLHVLSSSPRKHSGLFPYAKPRPRVYLQDILILLSEYASSSSSSLTPSTPQRVLVTAIEANVYNVPSTSCGILYISKVDGTAQGIAPSPTSTLVKALIRFYADPKTRPIHVDTIWVQLFARAQSQYLFPNSAEFEKKKPLSDVMLCKWWRRVFGEVAQGLVSGGSEGTAEEGKIKARLYYVLPGYNKLEAEQSLKLSLTATSSSSSQPQPQWTYGHPYTQTEIPLPCPPNPKGHTGLGHFIPSFDDDPKNRFMDEIALTTDSNSIKSPKKKKPRTVSGGKPNSKARPARDEEAAVEKKKEKEDEEEGEQETSKAQGELDKVTPDEFWERMSFRQECIAGAVTGFFALGVTSNARSVPLVSVPSPLAPQPGQVSPRLVRRVVASLMTGHEFSTTERSVRATQVLEEAIKGLCEGIVSVGETDTAPAKSSALSSSAKRLFLGAENDGDEEESETTAEGDAEALHAEAPRTPPPRRAHLPEVSPNPFPEPVTSLETYHSHIYGTVSVSNPALPPKSSVAGGGENGAGAVQDQPVRVLAVRKKKRKTDS
ncbi:histone acetylation protein-domain-containing protein [Cristinia sonorae]|uniref:histone acetyltransferase n=1 Tax=Cristinia sonorae TaxID=1940300 RepID=A0A8K0XTM9_9AGAR|nr:histone acetylation protein-domain-containing protein [Cristinia sonorae]